MYHAHSQRPRLNANTKLRLQLSAALFQIQRPASIIPCHQFNTSAPPPIQPHAPVSIKGVCVLLGVVELDVLIGGDHIILARNVPAQAALLEPLQELEELAGHALKGLLGGAHQQQQLDLAAPVQGPA